MNALAVMYNLTHTSYEGGAGVPATLGSTTNIGNIILANRSPRMRKIVYNDVFDNFFALGASVYNYFASVGFYSRYVVVLRVVSM